MPYRDVAARFVCCSFMLLLLLLLLLYCTAACTSGMCAQRHCYMLQLLLHITGLLPFQGNTESRPKSGCSSCVHQTVVKTAEALPVVVIQTQCKQVMCAAVRLLLGLRAATAVYCTILMHAAAVTSICCCCILLPQHYCCCCCRLLVFHSAGCTLPKLHALLLHAAHA